MAIRIRTGGNEFEVEDEAALTLLRERGVVAEDAERWVGGGWRPVQTREGVDRAPASDPWDAWSAVDDGAAEAALHRVVHVAEEEVAELPVGSVAAMPRAIVVARPPPPVPVAEPPRPQEPAAAPPPLAPPAPRDLGLLIGFPERKRRPPPPPIADEAVPLIRPWRLLGMIAGGLLLLAGAWAAAEMTRPEPTVPAVTKAGRPPPVVDPLKETERRLRAVALGATRPVRAPGQLEDAMTIELQKLGLRVVSVRAPVTRWTGRKDDDPATAEVHVTFRSDGELDAELGAIQLVTGRYKIAYTLDISVIEAILEDDQGTRATHLDANRAQRFAQGRIGLTEAVLPGA